MEIGPYRYGGLLLVPQIDAIAALERLERVEQEKEELPEELEDIGIALLAKERLAEPTPKEELIPVEDLARRLGLKRLLGK